MRISTASASSAYASYSSGSKGSSSQKIPICSSSRATSIAIRALQCVGNGFAPTA